MSKRKTANEKWCKSSSDYRKRKIDADFVAMNKYVPREMRKPLHEFINREIELFLKGGIAFTNLNHKSK